MIRTADNLIPLNVLRAGQAAEIVTILGHVDQVQRLEEMGLRNGADVTMIQPGSPCLVKLPSNTLCFRGTELTRVLVRPAWMVERLEFLLRGGA